MKPPRVVVVSRPTEYELLIARHATHAQARFFLQTRAAMFSQETASELLPRSPTPDIEEVEQRHHAFQEAMAAVLQRIPTKWRRGRVGRSDLDRFVFEPEDVIVAVGQDGLVANAAKYLSGQLVIGIDPSPGTNQGILVRHAAQATGDLLALAVARQVKIEARTMVEGVLDDGQRLLALNELFIGHRTHQSARYVIAAGEQQEHQSSSGIIVATGTGSTGWARSVHRERRTDVTLPSPCDGTCVYFVREAFPGRALGTSITDGVLDAGSALVVTSEMNEEGAVFGDGIEDDRLEFGFGQRLSVRASELRLQLVVG
jgi:NAD kinase